MTSSLPESDSELLCGSLLCFYGDWFFCVWINRQTCQLSWFSRESPSFSSNLPVSRLEYQISWELPTVALFNFFSLISLFSRCQECSEGLRVIFVEYSDIVENYIFTMQRFLAVSRFLYSGVWQVWTGLQVSKTSKAHNTLTPFSNKISILLAGVTWI